jgi:2-hydroxy-3-oxopropionate reductase
MERIGFIGLGIMGKPMAKNLLKAGFPLMVHDIVRPQVAELVGLGAEEAHSPKEVAQKCKTIITMLPNSPQVEEVLLGKEGVIEAASSGTLLIDMSSINPMSTMRISEEANKKGVRMLDAPVSGGEPGAIAGTLAIMVGGDKKDFEECRGILEKMGRSAVYVGKIGSGQTTKLVNQIIVALNLAAIAEGFVLGMKAGVDPQLIYEAIRGGLAGSTALEQKALKIFSGNFSPGFKIKLHVKDLTNALEAADSLGVPLFLTSTVNQMFKHLISMGEENNDHCSIIHFMEKVCGIEVRTKREAGEDEVPS